MLRKKNPSGHKARLGTRFAMAVALASGTMLAAGGIAAPASAQQAKADYSKNFVKVYKPVADAVNAEGGDYNAARAQIPAVLAAASTPDDRFAAGQLIVSLGGKLKDKALQLQGLQTMVASGKAPPEQLGQYNFFIGNLAFEAKDYPTARAALQEALRAGYRENDPEGLIAESYFAENNTPQGLSYLKGVIDQRTAAGTQVPTNWVLRGLKLAYESKDPQLATEWAGYLVSTNPTPENWTNAVQVVSALNQFDDQQYLDLLRLMRNTQTLAQANDYKAYIQSADPRRMANEVLAVIEEGVSSGKLASDDTYVQEARQIAQGRAAADRAETPGLVAEARSSSSGTTAMGTAEAFLSFGDYANAESMYQLALEKGVQNRDQVLTRLGIAQAMQGKYDAAQATFDQVSGPRESIAELWSIWADNKAGGVRAGG
ncbi:tetratricopeptide repeat protein [Altericroceibacterium xinjiangense]|uniref:tetratricopeptide repeat protein n=1 Tax=Altericroceibacterium xinjiangense TaxID=762261 RepID=UPI000F7F2CC6|nr:tetratricopeptide repeat protein [Altericroceibacterium xinjiangense]